MSSRPTAPWPSDRLQRVDRCPACGTTERRIAFGNLADTVFGCAPGLWSLWECMACRSGYLDPRPDETSIGMAYREYYTHDGDPSRSFLGRLLQIPLFAKAYNGRLRRRYGISRSPRSAALGLALDLLPFSAQYLDPFGRDFPEPGGGESRLLDFGCGDGGFLATATERGWRCKGIDFDAAAVTRARRDGIDAVHGGIAELEAERGYEHLRMSHVIEHLHDPRRALRACHDALLPGGTLWLETPNFRSCGRARYGEHWRGLEIPRHLTLFTPRALSRLLESVGFEQIRNRPPLLYFGVYQASRASRRLGRPSGKRLADLLHPAAYIDGVRTALAHDRADFIRLIARKPLG